MTTPNISPDVLRKWKPSPAYPDQSDVTIKPTFTTAPSITELSSLQAEHDSVMDEYRRVGMPLLERVAELSRKIRDIRREAGDLFYVEYMRYHVSYTEECDDFEGAKDFARGLEDDGEGYVKRIHGPGVDLSRHEWNA